MLSKGLYDLRLAARRLRARPPLTGALVVSFCLSAPPATTTYSAAQALPLRLLPFGDPFWRTEPGSDPPGADVRAGCDAAFAIVSNTAGVKTRRASGTFTDETFRAPIPGCRIVIDGSVRKAERTGAAAERLRNGLEAQGWQELPEFSADGHDGTSFAYKKKTVACFARGVWDGGADDDPALPPLDPYKLTVICGKAAMFVRPDR